MTNKQVDRILDNETRAILKEISKARGFRNPFVGKANEKLYRISASTMRRINKRLGK